MQALNSLIKATLFQKAPIRPRSNRKSCAAPCSGLSLVIGLLLMATLCGKSFAQEQSAPPSVSQFSSLLKGDGWTVPGLDGAAPKSARSQYKVGNLNGSVYVTMMKPGEKPGTLTWLHSSKDLPGVIEIQIIDVEVLQLWKFDIDGKVFAYGVSAGWLAREDRTGRLVKLGTVENRIFYDVDGSGKFALMKNANFPFVPELPKWVSQASIANDTN